MILTKLADSTRNRVEREKKQIQLEMVKKQALAMKKGDFSFEKIIAEGDISFTLEMEPSTEYKLVVNGVSAGRIPTNLGGKLNASLELDQGEKAAVKVVKC